MPRINLGRLQFEQGELPHCVEALYAVIPNCCAPVGFIWYRQILIGHTDILYVFVHEKCRRQRIAERMLEELCCWYPLFTVCTTTANEFSEPWLRAMRFSKESAGWFLRPPQPEICPMI